MDTITRTTRQATPERWQKALHRAFDEGITLLQISGTGECIATSASKAGVAYRTDGVTCECEAAQLAGDPVCKHRALYHFTNGVLTVDEPATVTVVTLDPAPEPEPPAPAAPRMWSQRDERLMNIAISNEVVNR